MVQPTIQNAREVMRELERSVAELDLEIKDGVRLPSRDCTKLHLAGLEVALKLGSIETYTYNLESHLEDWDEYLFRLTHTLAGLKNVVAELQKYLQSPEKVTVADDSDFASEEEMMLLRLDLRGAKRTWLKDAPTIVEDLDALPDQPPVEAAR